MANRRFVNLEHLYALEHRNLTQGENCGIIQSNFFGISVVSRQPYFRNCCYVPVVHQCEARVTTTRGIRGLIAFLPNFKRGQKESRTNRFHRILQFTETLALLRLLAAKNHSRHGARHLGRRRTDSPTRLRLRSKHLFLCVPAEINLTT